MDSKGRSADGPRDRELATMRLTYAVVFAALLLAVTA
jgi:hypothetical protein